jgi:hypothetical protein
VVCLGPRVPGEMVGPRPLSDVGARPLNFTVRAHMKVLRRVVLAISLVVILTWLCAWVPQQALPRFLYWATFWFGGLFTFLFLPAVVGVLWGTGILSRARPRR